MSVPGPKAEKLKAKQWGFSSEKRELFADEPAEQFGVGGVFFALKKRYWRGRMC